MTAAVLPNLVDDEDLSLAQAALGSVWGTMLFVGAALGGLVAGFLGRQTSFVVNAATFAASALLVLRIRRAMRTGPVPTRASVLSHLGGGAQWVLSTHGLQVTTPDSIRGRVMSLDFGLATLAIGVSSLVAGGAAELFGLTAASLIMASLALLYGVTWLAWTRDLWTGGDPFAPSEREEVAP